MNKSWLAVASAEHVRVGRAEGFMQVCHGKAVPLKRMKPGDRVVYYSSSEFFQGKDKFQSFTALGVISDKLPYPYDMGYGFIPYRRDVCWSIADETSIVPLLPFLDCTRDKVNWGYQLRFGLITITDHDFLCIAQAMNSEIKI